MLSGESRGQYRYRGEAHRDRAEPHLALQALAQLAQFLLEIAISGEYPQSPVQHALAFGGEADKALPALDNQDTESFLELLDTRRQSWLRYVASRGGACEVPFPGQCRKVFEITNDHDVTSGCFGTS